MIGALTVTQQQEEQEEGARGEGGGKRWLDKEVNMETSTHERVCAFLWVKQDSGSEAAGLLKDDAEVPGGDWCRGCGSLWQNDEEGGEEEEGGGGLRAVLEGERGDRMTSAPPPD